MDLQKAKTLVDAALSQGKFIILVGHCKVSYSGRAASKLSQGERVVLIKNDGTFLVHQTKGMAAINYQGPGAVIETEWGATEEKIPTLTVSALRKKRNEVAERIDVQFTEIYDVGSHILKDDRTLQLTGSERQLSDLLMQDLHSIEAGLVPIQQESHVRKGLIDILAQDRQGRLVVIEVKRREAGLDAVSQLHRYVHELSARKGSPVRGILLAPRITANAKTMLEKEKLEFVRLDYEIGSSATIKGLEKKQHTIGDFG